MKTWTTALACALLVMGLSARADELNQLSEQEKLDGWQLLFNGQNTVGWHSFNRHEAKRQWQVQDGVLALTRGGGGDLVTDKTYGDFDLRWEWRISYKGNSGVMYHVVENEGRDYPWRTGPEYQLLDNANLPEAPIEQAGALFALYAPVRDVTKPTGEWNESRLKIEHRHVQHWLNGVLIVEYELWSPDFTQRVAASKFASMPEFGRFDRGGIALQDHGDVVAFRNIKLRELP